MKNVKADVESRIFHSVAEWMLHPALCQWIIQLKGPCKVDLFAMRLNNQLPYYISWRPDPFAVATDAFQISWVYLNGYPVCLSPLLSGGEMPTENQDGWQFSSANNSSLTNPVLVPSASEITR